MKGNRAASQLIGSNTNIAIWIQIEPYFSFTAFVFP